MYMLACLIESNGERGYLTSNRSGGKGGDDIYQFELPPLKLFVKGVVTDSKTGGILTNASIELIGSDGSVVKQNTDNTGSYEFEERLLSTFLRAEYSFKYKYIFSLEKLFITF